MHEERPCSWDAMGGSLKKTAFKLSRILAPPRVSRKEEKTYIFYIFSLALKVARAGQVEEMPSRAGYRVEGLTLHQQKISIFK